MHGKNRMLNRVERFKDILVEHATGGSADEAEYKELRSLLVGRGSVSSKVPAFVSSCRTPGEFWTFIKARFGTYSERREFLRAEFDELLTHLEREVSPVEEGSAVLLQVELDHIEEAWKKSLDRLDQDPSGAITSARSLLEVVIGHLLEELGVKGDSEKLGKMYGALAERVGLSPSQHTEHVFKQILGGCHSVVDGLAAMRNHLGDSHRPRVHGVRPEPRHARLAVNLAGAISMFLVETWEARHRDG